MKRDAGVDLIMSWLGARTSATLRDKVIANMSYVQETLETEEQVLPWFLVTTNASTTTVTGNERVQLPDDFLVEYEPSALWIKDSSGKYVELVKEDIDYITKKYEGKANGLPKYYALVGNYFYFRPIPDNVYTIRMKYYARDASIAGTYGDANNIENKWLKFASGLVLPLTAALTATRDLQDPNKAAAYQGEVQAARIKLIQRTQDVLHTNMKMNMGDD